MALSDLMLGFYDWRVMSVVYVAIALPALAGLLPHRVRAPGIIAIILSSSLTFFATTISLCGHSPACTRQIWAA